MKKLSFAVCFFMIFSLGMVIAYADTPAYSLGTIQPTSKYLGNPGKNVTLKFYIFNAYGNRITHITFSVDNPDNLQVYLPPVQTNTWNISGILTPVAEQLYVLPMPMVSEKPAQQPEGEYYSNVEYLKTTNVTDYIPAKRVEVNVTMPEGAEYGTTYYLKIMAAAKWYGEAGTASVGQSRPFVFRLMLVAENYTEELYQPEEGQESTGIGLSNEIIFGIIIAVLVLVVLFQQFRPKHR